MSTFDACSGFTCLSCVVSHYDMYQGTGHRSALCSLQRQTEQFYEYCLKCTFHKNVCFKGHSILEVGRDNWLMPHTNINLRSDYVQLPHKFVNFSINTSCRANRQWRCSTSFLRAFFSSYNNNNLKNGPSNYQCFITLYGWRSKFILFRVWKIGKTIV